MSEENKVEIEEETFFGITRETTILEWLKIIFFCASGAWSFFFILGAGFELTSVGADLVKSIFGG